MSKKKFDFTSWLLLLVLAVIWGTSFILIKKGLISFKPTQVASIRISISFLSMIPFMVLGYCKIPKKGIAQFVYMAILGNGIPPFLYAIAQLRIDSGVAGILNALTPLFTLFIGILFFGTKSSFLKTLGVLIGLTGAAVLIIFQNTTGNVAGDISFELSNVNLYALLIVLATAFYGISVNILKVHFQEMEPISITSFIFMLIGPPAVIYLFTTDFVIVMQTDAHAIKSLLYLAILAVVGTAFSTVVFFKLVQRTSALFGSTVTYLIPIVAIMWGVLDGEYINLAIIGGMVLILTGVYLSRNRKNNT